MQKILKWLGYGILTIVLGALGSGLWEKVASPLFYTAGNVVGNYIGELDKSYENSFYSRIPLASVESHLSSFPLVVSFITIIVAIFLILNGWLNSDSVNSRGSLSEGYIFPFLINFFSKRKIVVVYMLIAFTAFTEYSFARSTYIDNVKRASLVSFELIRPFVDDAYFYKLRAKYFGISTKSDYVNFRAEIISVAESHQVKIPLADNLTK